MKLKNLIKDLPIIEIRGSQSITIHGICCNSKQVKPGDLFIAKRGSSYDGSEFIPSAVLAGAVAVITDMYNPFYDNIVQVVVQDVAAIEPTLAARFYKNPSKSLFTIGITGTSGKTTTTYLCKRLMEGQYGLCGLIGTIGTIINEHILPATLTTPDAVTLQNLLYEMVNNNCKNVVMEVSSHALDQNRVNEIDFDVCVFTNLSQDHLDYHHTMEHYAIAKTKLFDKQVFSLGKSFKKYAVINLDDALAPLMLQHCHAQVLTYGIATKADVTVKELKLFPTHSEFVLLYKGEEVFIKTSLIGRFNVYNLLAAATVSIARGMKMAQIGNILSTPIYIPGRMQVVDNALGIDIYVDYSHKPGGLKNVLETTREIKKGKLILVFGCGGNRDKSKRNIMMQIAKEYADEIIVTTDNPRLEDPKEIIRQMIEGINLSNVSIEMDRKKAIELAIMRAQKNDMILIAGKGHEREQIFQNIRIEFDDVFVAKHLCEDLQQRLLI
ncbi:MAG: UDP-N-acetylmuramoyl-L-alanyl-D-glutamate--2,6-diaminopimelate ligase [Chlamydiales bacterium]|nr:UDP-N-acetylmuramoyl-L-alanyl-D-glutamate--2,6-diaminopimelate ligase [Chlamydiales bacterium]